MKIRNFTLDDQQQLKELALKCWLFTYKDIYSDQKIRDTVDNWYSKDVHQLVVEGMKKGTTIAKVVEENGKLIGLINTLQQNSQTELKRLYVDPNYLRKGVGSKLLNLVEKTLSEKGIESYFCLVHKKNSIGQNFYTKSSFTYDDSYEDEEDLKMVKNI